MKIRSVTYSEALSGQHRHYHNDEQLLYITEGRARVQAEGREYLAAAGSLVLFSRHERHAVEVEGAALLGFGSGDPKPAYNYTGNTTRTFRGRAMAIVRGEGTVTVRCDMCSAVLSVN